MPVTRLSKLMLIISSLVFVNASASSDLSLRYRLSYGKSWMTGEVLSYGKEILASRVFSDFEGISASSTLGLDVRIVNGVHIGLGIGASSTLSTCTLPRDTIYQGTTQFKHAVMEHVGSVSITDGVIRTFVGMDLPLECYIEIGASALVNTSNSLKSVYRTVWPATARYLPDTDPEYGRVIEDGRALLYYESALQDFPAMRIDIDASIGKSFVIRDVTLQLLATYQHGLQSLTSMRSLKSNSLSGAFGFSYTL